MRKNVFVTVLKEMGMGEEEMMNFHATFEKTDSNVHREFLEFLELTDEQIEGVLAHLTK